MTAIPVPPPEFVAALRAELARPAAGRVAVTLHRGPGGAPRLWTLDRPDPEAPGGRRREQFLAPRLEAER